MEIIVLRITNYKEKDGIIDTISKDGQMSFLCRGLFDSKSKNNFLNNPLTIADIEISEGKYKYPVIKSSMQILSPINLHADLRYMSVLMGINEATNYLLGEEEKPQIYDELKEAIIALKEENNPYLVFLPFLAKVLKKSGYDFEVNQCIQCGNRKGIVTFSFEEGGFICSSCYNPSIKKLFNKEQLLLIREAFNTNKAVISSQSLDDSALIFVIDKFFEFIYDSYGYKMKVKDLIK